jgi:hypothetical protein
MLNMLEYLKKIGKTILKWLNLAFLTIGMIWTVHQIFQSMNSTKTEAEKKQEKSSDEVWHLHNTRYSPDHKYKAVAYNSNGGGGISPYCIDTVAVLPSKLSDELGKNDQYLVYVGGCHTTGYIHTKYEQTLPLMAPLLYWSSNNRLEITFDEANAKSGANFLFHRQDISGKITVEHKVFSEE